jgi:hypothetical protein
VPAYEELARIIASGEAMLFTGAGFSTDARDLDDRPLPDTRQMIRELWEICFGTGPDADPPDESSLADLYDVALMCARDRLCEYVARRLRIGDEPLPPYLAAWFGAPWRRIYTLNIDDIEVAVQRQFRLPRPLRSVSAVDPDRTPPADPAALDVVHLNGMAGDDPRTLTFSTLQYAARLCGRDREYERLAVDLVEAPFVFAGTTLDEVVLWQHLERQRRRDGRDLAHRPGFLIARDLPRARRVLLESMRVEWVQGTIAEVGAAVLAGRR